MTLHDTQHDTQHDTLPPRPARRRWLSVLAAGGLAAGLDAPVRAQSRDWPVRPVRLVVPFSPGTGIDILARVVAPRLSERWGQPVVVENRPGASGNIGAAQVAKAAADGHQLLMGVNTLVINPALYANMSYDPFKDLAPIGLAATGTFLVVAHAGAGVRTLSDLVAKARARPGAIDYASPGIATPHHMGMELLKARAKISLTHIPFANTAGAVTALLSGDVPLMFLPVHVAAGHLKSGRVVALATAGPRRSALAPDVPTLAEQGLPGVDADLWYGLLAPAGIAAPVRDAIARDLRDVLAEAEVGAALVRQGMAVRAGAPAEMAELMRADGRRWAELIRQAGIRADN